MDQVERTARLIRSKGVGIYFVTQAPTDVPSPVLAQLGNRVQHALRAFTPDDADALRKTARTFPTTTFYDVETTITSLGTGEALVTVLSPDGVPTPLAATRLLPPDSLMAPISEEEFSARVAESPLVATYGTPVDPESAYEMITARLQAARAAVEQDAMREQVSPTTNSGLNTMTPAQQRREMQRQARELREAQKAADRQRREQAKEQARIERERQETMQTAIRTGGDILTSRTGQSVLRGIFGTIFGGGKSR